MSTSSPNILTVVVTAWITLSMVFSSLFFLFSLLITTPLFHYLLFYRVSRRRAIFYKTTFTKIKTIIKLPNTSLVFSTHHCYIGLYHIMSGLIGGSVGYGLPTIIRLELALPGFPIRSSPQYNTRITFHGLFTTSSMIMPILIGGFGNIPLPLPPRPSDMIFPRMNALSLWFVIDSLFVMFLGITIDGGVNAGRTSYVPPPIMNSSSIDFMFFPLHLVGLSPLSGSINFI